MADDFRYAFICEWYEELAARTRTFQFFYYSGSKSIEMFDVKTRKMFLKTNLASTPIELQDLYIGASINVLGRQLTIVDFGDEFTKRKLMSKLERTLGYIKPDAVERMGEVISAIYDRGLAISKMRLCKLNQNDAFRFYQEHAGKSFMQDLMNYVTSGPILAMELVGDNAVLRWRELIGPTDPAKARSEAASSLRARFGRDVTHNAVHGSDSPASAAREVEFFFPSCAKQTFTNCVAAAGCTLCVIKPHAVKAGLAGKIISAIQDQGFLINTIQLFNIEKANAEEFYEVYKGVVHEYPGMVNELTAGPVIGMEILAKSKTGHLVEEFREFCGPMDPEIARHLRPRTLRAIYGLNKIQNAVHCTDLPDDGPLEVEYFFKVLDRSA
ncbi:nucleoside diphosphate kinase 7-like isoform X2 [Physella acuta]|uniref:nucleoside diphosphate kinase 7-like isoform X2 n=1 Tax=Physella acuta TaxID=109671 RepID=UPI0027DD9E03|nr:nucleoside diphosphate kinase 7-like isoform X2 [Physella acuta]